MERLLYLAGRWQPAKAGGKVTVTNPATGEAVGETSTAGPEDLDTAVAVALSEGRHWAEAPAEERSLVLHRAAQLLRERGGEIAPLLTAEQGKPLPDAAKEVAFAATVFQYYAEEAVRVGGSLRHSARPDVKSIVSYAPFPVAGAIIPWNYPVDLYAWKVAPALAAGCAVVAKPPQDAPLAIGEVVRALDEAGLPQGALADLPAGPEVGRALAAHAGVGVLAATVSSRTGQEITALAAPTLKRVALELGGQSPFIVLDDADLEDAAAAAVRRGFSNMGQICIAVNRVLVARSRHDEFVEAVRERTRALRLGDGLQPGVEYGPLFSRSVLERTEFHLADALYRGARLVTGGERPQDVPEGGVFFLPTVLDEVPPTALVMREETFGPIIPVAAASDDSELLDLANSSAYGLAAYVYSGDLERAWALAERLEVGSVGINVNDVTELQAPFGGWKLSGDGRDLGREGLFTYLRSRHIRARVRPLAHHRQMT
jgi:succinate-semialdehyde dehydrogenase/glutarate-semialdehyde dehydrogenase